MLIVNEKHFSNGLFLINRTKMGSIFDPTKNLIFTFVFFTFHFSHYSTFVTFSRKGVLSKVYIIKPLIVCSR
ncbi:hypothetical protein BGP_4022 [Beggiatoa sp. PS]|nr:hypothetical protein BGP_4022 [Beggiatoa sp. PS]